MTAEDGEYWAELERKSNEAARVLLGTAIKRIAQLEAALVEEKAKALYYAYADRSYIYGWLDANEDDREQWQSRSRVELEELGILQNGAK